MAIVDRIGMLKVMEDLSESKPYVQNIKSMTSETSKKEHSTAMAEMAYFLEDIGPVLYHDSKTMYENALSWYLSPTSDISLNNVIPMKMSRKELTWWFLNLAKLYNRMLNRGNMQYFPSPE